MKDLNNVKSVVNNIIKETFTALQTVYQKQNNDLQIIFPEYASHNKRSGKIRISEQELRFAFVEVAKKLTKDKGWHYSVETPTYFYYKSARNGNDSCIGGARSGKIDLTLYDDSKLPVALIEFKAGSLSVDDENHCNKALKYDMIKLIAETRHYQCLGYSLHLMDNSSYLKSFDSHLIAATEIIKGSKCLKEFESEEIKNFNLEISELKKYIFYKTCILNK